MSRNRRGALFSTFRGEWLLLPNLVTYLRGVSIPVFVVFLLRGEYAMSLVALAVIGVSDWADGFLARRLTLVSNLGLCLDPLLDRLSMIVIAVSCAGVGLISWWLLIPLLAPEVVLGGIVLRRPKLSRTIQPTRMGKLRTALLFVGFPLLILSAQPVLDSSAVNAVAVTVVVLGAIGHVIAGMQYARALLSGEKAPSPTVAAAVD